jgi:hypothetical protein
MTRNGETIAPNFSDGGSLFHGMANIKKQPNGVMEPSSSSTWAQFPTGGVGSVWWRTTELGSLKVNFWVELRSGSAICRQEMIYMWERWTLTRVNLCLLQSRQLDEGEGAPAGWAKPHGMGWLDQLKIRKEMGRGLGRLEDWPKMVLKILKAFVFSWFDPK